MACARTRSGLLVRIDGSPVDADYLHSLRVAEIDQLVTAKGPVQALAHYERAELVARRLAGEAFKRCQDSTAAGLLAAADYLRGSIRLLVERHA
jgi:hypothetical protein